MKPVFELKKAASLPQSASKMGSSFISGIESIEFHIETDSGRDAHGLHRINNSNAATWRSGKLGRS
ncbi:hypothetical protein UP10_41895 [Bradyrhizobium sp. LTSPM299]|nr:hypothetical protein UP10_41895 [Bradyrhizobium sp. LTSPM299]